MSRIVLAAGACLVALCGCDKMGLSSPPDVQACEAFTKDQLRSPSTFKTTKVISHDSEKMSLAEFYKETGLAPPKESPIRTLDELHEYDGLALRQVGLEYEASNAYGVPVKGVQVCAFRLIAGKLESDDQLRSNVTRAQGGVLTDQMDAMGYDTREIKKISGPRPRFNCCL